MRLILYIFLTALSIVLFSVCNDNLHAEEPSKVTLEHNDKGQYRLFVNGEEFFVKGAGLEFGSIEALAENGANSFRTWRTKNGKQDALEILDKAHENGLMVLMGLEVGSERHGFDYNDAQEVKKQFEHIKTEVTRLKNHPALLGWAIGNELNLFSTNLKVFDAVNDLSKMIHTIDPNHPTTTPLAGITNNEVDYIKNHCTDIDFISVQMYGDIVNLQKRIADAGWDGPYMVTEWGATGHWEVERTNWDVAIEHTSQEKAKAFINRYDLAIAPDKTNCLGSYVFLWGQKQERTPTWYGMFLENGAKTETVDAMHYLWTGRWPVNRCPSIDAFLLNGKTSYDNIHINKNEPIVAEVFAKDHENDHLVYRWEVMEESTDLKSGGDHESTPQTIFKKEADNKINFQLPNAEGAHRLFIYVTDHHGNAATANIPFFIE